MPIKAGASDKIIGQNIKALMKEGKPMKQAIAIAMQKAGREKPNGEK